MLASMKGERQLLCVFLLLGVLLGIGIGHLAPAGEQVTNYVKRLTYPAVVTIETKTALGSGFFISSAGHVLTCCHVLAGGDEVTVVNGNGARLPAKVAAADPQRDLAVLKVDAASTPLLRLGENKNACEERIYLFGHREGSPEWTDGELITTELPVDGHRYMQIQGKVVPGYSGGPLLDANGNVLGVVTELVEGTDLALAIPAGVIKDFLNNQHVPYSFVSDELLPETSTGRRWMLRPDNWANLSLAGKGLILLLPTAVLVGFISFLRWCQRKKRKRREDDFEIEFPAGSGY